MDIKPRLKYRKLRMRVKCPNCGMDKTIITSNPDSAQTVCYRCGKRFSIKNVFKTILEVIR